MNLRVAVQAQKLAFSCFDDKHLPGGVRASSEVKRERFKRWIKVVKSKRRLVAIVTAQLASAISLLNQQLPSLSPALLLGNVILMFVVCEAILAPS